MYVILCAYEPVGVLGIFFLVDTVIFDSVMKALCCVLLPSALVTALSHCVQQDKVALLKPPPETAEQCRGKTITALYSSYSNAFK